MPIPAKVQSSPCTYVRTSATSAKMLWLSIATVTAYVYGSPELAHMAAPFCPCIVVLLPSWPAIIGARTVRASSRSGRGLHGARRDGRMLRERVAYRAVLVDADQ